MKKPVLIYGVYGAYTELRQKLTFCTRVKLLICAAADYTEAIDIMWWRRRRVAAEHAVLTAMYAGAVLKAHRDLDGAKLHKLHRSGARPERIDAQIVRRLERKQLIQSNMKFPAATYLLTEQGAALARSEAERGGT